MTARRQQLITVDDGIKLVIQTSGSGGPPVICVSCAGGAHDEWAAATARLSGSTQVVTYGRPSLGGSDPLPAPLAGGSQTVRWAATQLRTLLHTAEIAPPYVLLTSSVGGWIADQYTALRPDEVAGMVLVDPTMPSAWPVTETGPVLVDGDDDDPGCIRFVRDDGYAELAESVPPRRPCRVVISGSDGRWIRDPPETPWYEPLTLFEVEQLWQASQREWVRRLDALHVIADTAGHLVHRDQPDLVAHVTNAVVQAAAAEQPIRLEPDEVAAAGGRVKPASC